MASTCNKSFAIEDPVVFLIKALQSDQAQMGNSKSLVFLDANIM